MKMHHSTSGIVIRLVVQVVDLDRHAMHHSIIISDGIGPLWLHPLVDMFARLALAVWDQKL